MKSTIYSTVFIPAVALLALSPTSLLGAETEPPQPELKIWVDGKPIEGPRITEVIGENGKVTYSVEKWVAETLDYKITLDLAMDPDPVIGYVLGVADFGAPSSFAFLFSTPIVPTGSPNTVVAGIVGGLTDITGDGVTITPTFAAVQISSVGLPLTSMGVDVGPAFTGGPGVPFVYPYGGFVSGPIVGPAPGPWTTLQAAVEFGLSGGGDLAGLTGFAIIREGDIIIPEAGATGGMVMLGTLAVSCWRRQRATRG